MTKTLKALKQRKYYDRFLNHIQKYKMTELWDNKEDETWENI